MVTTQFKQHWMFVCAPALCTFIAIGIPVVLILNGVSHFHLSGSWPPIILLRHYAVNLVMLPTLLIALVRLLIWRYAFIEFDGGVIAWRVSMSDERRVPTWSIREARVQRSFIGALFNYGDVIIDTGLRIECIPWVPAATQFAAMLLPGR